MELSGIERRLGDALAGSLPGATAQKRLAPEPRRGWQPDRVPPGCRDGAGLLLLFPGRGGTHLVLTVRDGNLPLHAGQVSLPGGAVEPGETIEQAALREAHEEVDLDPATVRVLGRLSPLHIPVSEFVLHPVVATVDRRPSFRPEPGEVARILEVSIDHLVDPRNLRVERKEFRGRTYQVPVIGVDGERLWGATAMVLSEFFELIGRPVDPWERGLAE